MLIDCLADTYLKLFDTSQNFSIIVELRFHFYDNSHIELNACFFLKKKLVLGNLELLSYLLLAFVSD